MLSSPSQGQPRAVWAVFFACIIAFMGLGLVDPILPAIASQLGASPSQVALLFTSYNAIMAVAMMVAISGITVSSSSHFRAWQRCWRTVTRSATEFASSRCASCGAYTEWSSDLAKTCQKGSAASAVVELEGPRGRMKIELKGITTAELVALSRALWDGEA